MKGLWNILEPKSEIFLSSARKEYIIPVKLTAIILCHSSSSSSATGLMPWCFPTIPAQFAAPSTLYQCGSSREKNIIGEW